MTLLFIAFTAGALIVNRSLSQKISLREYSSPKNTKELIDSLKHFVSMIGQTPLETFYENWRVVGETIFHPNHLIEAIEKEGTQAERSVRIVLKFMGFAEDVYAASNLKSALTQLHKSKTPCSFDDDRFTELLFSVVDLDQSQGIDTNELKEMLESFVLTEELRKQDLFHGFDKQSKGRLNLTEFQDWWSDALSHQLQIADNIPLEEILNIASASTSQAPVQQEQESVAVDQPVHNQSEAQTQVIETVQEEQKQSEEEVAENEAEEEVSWLDLVSPIERVEIQRPVLVSQPEQVQEEEAVKEEVANESTEEEKQPVEENAEEEEEVSWLDLVSPIERVERERPVLVTSNTNEQTSE